MTCIFFKEQHLIYYSVEDFWSKIKIIKIILNYNNLKIVNIIWLVKCRRQSWVTMCMKPTSIVHYDAFIVHYNAFPIFYECIIHMLMHYRCALHRKGLLSFKYCKYFMAPEENNWIQFKFGHFTSSHFCLRHLVGCWVESMFAL